MSIEERLYNCFKNVFDENNGKLCVPLDGSNIVFEEVSFACGSEFFDEMFERWLSEGNKDKNRN